MNVLIEKLFMKNKIKGFDNISEAIQWARSIQSIVASKAS